MISLTPKHYTSEVAEAIVTKLDNLTSNQTLNSSEVRDTVNVLKSLVTLQENVLEEEKNLSLSNTFVDVR